MLPHVLRWVVDIDDMLLLLFYRLVTNGLRRQVLLHDGEVQVDWQFLDLGGVFSRHLSWRYLIPR